MLTSYFFVRIAQLFPKSGRLPFRQEYAILQSTKLRAHPVPGAHPVKEGLTMKFLKVLLAVLTCLAVTLTGVLLFVDKHGPRYIQIDNSED